MRIDLIRGTAPLGPRGYFWAKISYERLVWVGKVGVDPASEARVKIAIRARPEQRALCPLATAVFKAD